MVKAFQNILMARFKSHEKEAGNKKQR